MWGDVGAWGAWAYGHHAGLRLPVVRLRFAGMREVAWRVGAGTWAETAGAKARGPGDIRQPARQGQSLILWATAE